MKEKALLLYSGGLDTSVMIKWLQEQLNFDVVTLTLDVGQEKNDLERIAIKAKDLGAVKTITEDVTEKFSYDFVAQGIMNDGLYQDKYPLSTSLARPLMSMEAVKFAEQNECTTVVHGSTGKGNDQVRFEVSIKALNENLSVIAPVREMNMNRDEEIEYARMRNIEIPYGGKYSVDENLWGRSVEGSNIELINEGVPEDAYRWVLPIEKSAEKAEVISITFNNGLPVKLNGKAMLLADLITELNYKAGQNGVGAIDLIEDRVVGIKSHEFYECPAAVTIINGHKYLESLVLNKRESQLKRVMDQQFAEMVYSGLWFDPAMEHIKKFQQSINLLVNGTVKLKLYKGNVIPMGVESSNSLYDVFMSTYGKNQTFDQSKAPGFIYVFGSQTITTSKVRKKQLDKIVIEG
ncbi:MAG: argininosuccinate synthase [Candidatus Thermoplasmatota archaeon]|jgi:argininosuccinate synthase|nr:argininosuccinate synthase [Cuniculiplasma sp.]MCL4320211.1 argininosuccinate synthase [Candidatus Thermoplasmatota archaeon]MCL6014327.1 argininosuccinate synthase [Candidatus Thermoplasmatota archaeon]